MIFDDLEDTMLTDPRGYTAKIKVPKNIGFFADQYGEWSTECVPDTRSVLLYKHHGVTNYIGTWFNFVFGPYRVLSNATCCILEKVAIR